MLSDSARRDCAHGSGIGSRELSATIESTNLTGIVLGQTRGFSYTPIDKVVGIAMRSIVVFAQHPRYRRSA
jgi:hypothetical protein